MKKYIAFTFLFLFICSCKKTHTEPTGKVDKQTFVFSVKGTDTLRLDKYDIPAPGVQKPCVVFVFGGSFVGGSRIDEYNADYLKRLAERGYVAIGIDYRLGLKDIKDKDISNAEDLVGLLMNAINMAVEDLFDATTFVCNHAAGWGIDENKIVANGSSAGAVTVLQAEYMISNKTALTERLPGGFCYAGIIAFAGAIANLGGDLTWPVKPAPIQLFHGDADRNVPFDKAVMGSAGLYGSNYIARQLDEMQAPYYFFAVENVAHEIAGWPMVDNLDEIATFIEKYVVKQKQFIINVTEEQIGAPELKKDFDFTDYINANYR
ncbi:MAG: carboxylesterase family protein [Tannerellaceae bacterium]|jgi:dienelactone hydrolase|nr:carboxylesterase family protein [Tannerellaceae bacterium]